jgi:hypothetical protein
VGAAVARAVAIETTRDGVGVAVGEDEGFAGAGDFVGDADRTGPGLGVCVTTIRGDARALGVGGVAVTIATGSFVPRWPSIESAAPMMKPATITPIRMGINGNDAPLELGRRYRRGLSSIEKRVSARTTRGLAK